MKKKNAKRRRKPVCKTLRRLFKPPKPNLHSNPNPPFEAGATVRGKQVRRAMNISRLDAETKAYMCDVLPQIRQQKQKRSKARLQELLILTLTLTLSSLTLTITLTLTLTLTLSSLTLTLSSLTLT